MKKTNIVLSILLACMVVTAYGSCYLSQVICCYTVGESVTNWTPPGCSSTMTYANEESWTFNTYSVSSGGRTGIGNAATTYCDGTNQWADNGNGPNTVPFALPNSGNPALSSSAQGGIGFVVYYNSCITGTGTLATNGPSTDQATSYGAIYQIDGAFPIHIQSTSATSCN